MIIPTSESDPLFAEDGTPFREKMLVWIQREFADVLGKNVSLLKSPGGLQELSRVYSDREFNQSPQKKSA